MPRWVQVINRSRGGIPLLRARWCQSFLCRLRGLTFRRTLSKGQGVLLVDSKESVSNAGIHMWFVFIELGIIWMNEEGKVVDTCLAKPWRMYFPEAPAKYILEGSPNILKNVSIGELVEFSHEG